MVTFFHSLQVVIEDLLLPEGFALSRAMSGEEALQMLMCAMTASYQ